MYLIFLLYALFASVFTISKAALQYTEPFFLIGIRMITAGLLMLGYEYFVNPQGFRLCKQDIFKIGKLGLLNIYLTNALEYWGLQHLTSFKTCFIYSLSPFVSALFSYLMLKESMNSKKWRGLLVGFIGFIPILMSQSRMEEITGRVFFLSWAEIAVVGAAVCSVYGWILLRQLVNENRVSLIMANGVSMLMGGGISIVHSAAVENWNPVPVTSAAPFLMWSALLLLISNLIAYNLYGYLLKRYTATFLSFAGLTTAIFAALFGWAFLGEEITVSFYISLATVFAGLFLFHQEELKQGYKVMAQS